MRLCNCDLIETFLPVNTFDEVLEHLKGKCKMNLDRSIGIIEPVMKMVRRHGMEDHDPDEERSFGAVSETDRSICTRYRLYADLYGGRPCFRMKTKK